jgi:hypothetical protein
VGNHAEINITKEEIQELFRNLPELLKGPDKEGQRKLIDFIINEIKWFLKTGDNEGEIEIFF